MEQFDPRVDAYVAKSADFAKPILEHIRQLVHEASPLITENIKWGFPFFEYKGIVCQMAAFKNHMAFGFWRASRLNDPNHLLNPGEEAAAGSFGRIMTIDDLPAPEILKEFILQAMALNELEGEAKKKAKSAPKEKKPAAPKKELVIPEYFAEALKGHETALKVFYDFSYSHKKEYVEWVMEAKTEATRDRRMLQAIEMMTEGKSRNWKYQNC